MKTIEEIQAMLDGDINQAIAAHKGKITITGRNNGVVGVVMVGGCQGCAGARFTLRSIVSEAIKEFDPTVETIEDLTDHAAGVAPFYKKTSDGKEE